MAMKNISPWNDPFYERSPKKWWPDHDVLRSEEQYRKAKQEALMATAAGYGASPEVIDEAAEEKPRKVLLLL